MDFSKTERTTLKRLPKRGVYERNSVYEILDEGFICHVGFVVDGKPVVIPTGYARIEDQLYIHGSQASRMLRALSGGIDVCVTVTLVDGLVLARSAFHHSINYRSVVIFGRASLVEDADRSSPHYLHFLNTSFATGGTTFAHPRRRNSKRPACFLSNSLRLPQKSGLDHRWMTKTTILYLFGLELFHLNWKQARRLVIRVYLTASRFHRMRPTTDEGAVEQRY